MYILPASPPAFIPASMPLYMVVLTNLRSRAPVPYQLAYIDGSRSLHLLSLSLSLSLSLRDLLPPPEPSQSSECHRNEDECVVQPASLSFSLSPSLSGASNGPPHHS